MANMPVEVRRWVAAAVAPGIGLALFMAVQWPLYPIETADAPTQWALGMRTSLLPTYFISAGGAALLLLVVKLTQMRPSILRLIVLLPICCAAFVVLFGLLTPGGVNRHVGAGAVFSALPAPIMAVVFGLVAGVPWRTARQI